MFSDDIVTPDKNVVTPRINVVTPRKNVVTPCKNVVMPVKNLLSFAEFDQRQSFDDISLFDVFFDDLGRESSQCMV